MLKKTYQNKKQNIKREWILIDAQSEVLGRLATKAVGYLTGKSKIDYTFHVDAGDYVVIINAEKIKLTGKKMLNKVYYSHSGYPGGLKAVKLAKLSKENPQKIISFAISRMLPDNRLKEDRLSRLKIFKGDKHPYSDKIKK